MVRFIGRAWRDELAAITTDARRSMLVAAPFIKEAEAAWFRGRLRPGVDVLTLANLDAEAVGASVLDLGALRQLGAASAASRVIALSKLHAKVFVADETAAIVTSGNLTRSALDANFEYGTLVDESALVRNVRDDMLAYARLGAEVTAEVLAALAPLEAELRRAHAANESSATPEARQAFREALRDARPKLAAVQVGDRSANAIFSEAITLALANGPLTTAAIGDEVRQLIPSLCDDAEELVINGERYGKAWKHRLRNAQQYLKRSGSITYAPHTRTWART